MKKILPLLFILCCLQVNAQVQFTSSNLPIVLINTGGTEIPDEPKINATMAIINSAPGLRNDTTQPHNEYDGNIGIEVRGQSSQMFPMKSYSIELRDADGGDNDKPLFGMPEESDWVLYAPYNDKTLMHNFLAYNISNNFGHWAAHTKYVEVFLNGQYVGVYVFMEKIKRDKGRVNIKKLEPEDNTPDKVSGGYIIAIDKDADAWTSAYRAPNTFVKPQFKYVYPKVEDITPTQTAYIKSYVDSFENALHGTSYQDPAKGFRNFADERSFIDFFIVNELSRNVDGYRISSYFYKDRDDVNKKIVMGPVWDYDIAFRNADYCNGSNVDGWAYNFNYVCQDTYSVPFWWERLMQDTAFESNLLCRWKEVRQTTLSTASLFKTIDSVAGLLNEAQQRHFTQWPVLGQYVWPNPYPIPATYNGEINTLKNWLTQRLAWIDNNLPQTGSCKNIIDTVPNPVANFTVTVRPNPVTSFLQLAFKSPVSQSIDMKLYDALGKKILQRKIAIVAPGSTFRYNASALVTGVYYLYCTNSAGALVKQTILKQ